MRGQQIQAGRGGQHIGMMPVGLRAASIEPVPEAELIDISPVRTVAVSGTAHSHRWVWLALVTLALSLGVTVLWTFRLTADERRQPAPSPTAQPGAAPSPMARRPVFGGGPIFLLMPDEHALLATAMIPVAGYAYARPHGPSIRAVRVEVMSAGSQVGGATISVSSGRFAGTVSIPCPLEAFDVVIRVNDADRPRSPWVQRKVIARLGEPC